MAWSHIASSACSIRSAARIRKGSGRCSWFVEVTRFSTRLPCRFERASTGSQFAILLHGKGFGHRMPMRRVLWSQAFADEETRDRLFFWLAVRHGRWADWGQRAWKDGAVVFTHFLLELVAIALPGPDVGQPVALLSGPALNCG